MEGKTNMTLLICATNNILTVVLFDKGPQALGYVSSSQVVHFYLTIQ